METLQDLQGRLVSADDGGGRFAIQGVRTLQLSSGEHVDAIIINGVRHGGSGGGLGKVLTLASDEYFISIRYRSGEHIDYLAFTTNKGQTLTGGGSDDGAGIVSGQIYAIGGWSGQYVDSLEVAGFNLQV